MVDPSIVFGVVITVALLFLLLILKGANMNVIKEITDSGLEITDNRMYDFSEEELRAICNGCGAAGSWLNYFIPSRYRNIDFTPACLKHDFGYYMGESFADKVEADLQFLIDLMLLCNMDVSVGRKELNKLHSRAYLYFSAVDKYGHNAFEAGKGISLPLDEIIKKLPDPDAVYSRGVGDIY